MFTTGIQHSNADALAGDFAAIARIEASLARAGAPRRRALAVRPGFARLLRLRFDPKS